LDAIPIEYGSGKEGKENKINLLHKELSDYNEKHHQEMEYHKSKWDGWTHRLGYYFFYYYY
jgi:hypothetical protein